MTKSIAYVPENLGKTDPQYGGVLTDVNTLPVGTQFFVCNGCWWGEIREENGARVLDAYSASLYEVGLFGLNPVSTTVLTEPHILAIKIEK